MKQGSFRASIKIKMQKFSRNILKLGEESSRKQYVAFTGIALHSILSPALLREVTDLRGGNGANSELFAACYKQWVGLATTLVNLPEPLELFLVVHCHQKHRASGSSLIFLAVGRGENEAHARERSERATETLWGLLTTNLSYAEFAPISESQVLKRVVAYLHSPYVLDVRRRTERLRVSQGHIERTQIGFGSPAHRNEAEKINPSQHRDTHDIYIEHLFPWSAGDDSWQRLFESLASAVHPTALIIHVQGHERAPQGSIKRVREAMAAAEK
ncbi:MAG: hypothetical protein LC778_20680, partial [Acidobacteria bacterium]|nr:hypothetical protein [Acidobacteriota bacterium]